MHRPRMTYARAGVDVSQIRKSHKALARRLESTFKTRKGRVGHPILPIGHYPGLFDLHDGGAVGLDTGEVGTKVIIALMIRKDDTIGRHSVAMCANDVIWTCAAPTRLLV